MVGRRVQSGRRVQHLPGQLPRQQGRRQGDIGGVGGEVEEPAAVAVQLDRLEAGVVLVAGGVGVGVETGLLVQASYHFLYYM